MNKDKKDKKNKLKKKKNKKEEIDKTTQLNALIKSIKNNLIFIFSILLSSYILLYDKTSNKNFISIIVTFVGISCFGYFVHLISHYINLTKFYQESNYIFKHINIINKMILKVTNLYDFHSEIHHDTSINKKYINLFYEFIGNFFTQGLQFFILIRFAKFLDERVCFIWGLAYATIHNINYYLYPPSTHIDHHINDLTNHGIDIYDIIFGSKYNWDDIENCNHFAINFILITIFVYYFNKYKHYIYL